MIPALGSLLLLCRKARAEASPDAGEGAGSKASKNMRLDLIAKGMKAELCHGIKPSLCM
jgi:hypothetical protein